MSVCLPGCAGTLVFFISGVVLWPLATVRRIFTSCELFMLEQTEFTIHTKVQDFLVKFGKLLPTIFGPDVAVLKKFTAQSRTIIELHQAWQTLKASPTRWSPPSSPFHKTTQTQSVHPPTIMDHASLDNTSRVESK